MIECARMNRMLHSIIGVSLLFIFIFLYIGLRPIFVIASLALGIFLIDYALLPFIYLYDAFFQWIPLLFELNIFNGILIVTRIFHLSKFWSFIFLSISIIRSIVLIYCHYLPIQDHHRLYIETNVQLLLKFILNKLKILYCRFIELFHSNDDENLDKFQLDQIKSDDNFVNEHDETIQRFQKLADQLSSPTLSNIECSTNLTPPIRRNNQRVIPQNAYETLSETPITPDYIDSPKGKILHSTINGSYAGPMTRNRTKTGGKSANTKMINDKDLTFIISK